MFTRCHRKLFLRARMKLRCQLGCCCCCGHVAAVSVAITVATFAAKALITFVPHFCHSNGSLAATCFIFHSFYSCCCYFSSILFLAPLRFVVGAATCLKSWKRKLLAAISYVDTVFVVIVAVVAYTYV